jgi:adenylate kinase family enzyme
MEAYEQSTKPLIDFYRKRGLLVTVIADGSPEEIYEHTLRELDVVTASD